MRFGSYSVELTGVAVILYIASAVVEPFDVVCKLRQVLSVDDV